MTWGLLGVVIVLGLLLERVGHRRRVRQAVQSRLRALEQIHLLRLLLEQVQRHRGLCFGFMSGEVSLEAQRWSVSQHVQQLLERAAEHQANLFWYAPWHTVLPLWEQIEHDREKASAEAVLQLHHRLADRILSTIESLGNRHDLICLGALAPQPQGMWMELLRNTEMLGQARAIGTGIAARRQNSALQHQELRRLREQIIAQVYVAPARLSTEPSLRALLDGQVREAEESLDAMVSAMDQLLASLEQPGMRSITYFSIATQAICAQLDLVDLLIDHLRTSIK
ncbi:MAG: nitrate- and nitrite sensing domain-containing protein [Pseudomonas sp.]